MSLMRMVLLLDEEYIDQVPERLKHLPYLELSCEEVHVRRAPQTASGKPSASDSGVSA